MKRRNMFELTVDGAIDGYLRAERFVGDEPLDQDPEDTIGRFVYAIFDSLEYEAWDLMKIAAHADRLGTDFFYSRHGHGCGFWENDHPWCEREGLADRLQAESERFFVC